jgi:hypothetical protein
MRRAAWLALSVLASAWLRAQVPPDTLCVVFGAVKDFGTGDFIAAPQVEVHLFNDTSAVPMARSEMGRYVLYLLREGDYTITYTAPGYAPKQVRVLLSGPTPEQWRAGYGLQVDVSLFRQLSGLDLDFGGPVGLCRYVAAEDRFEWDPDHTRALKPRAEAMAKAYRKRLAE